MEIEDAVACPQRNFAFLRFQNAINVRTSLSWQCHTEATAEESELTEQTTGTTASPQRHLESATQVAMRQRRAPHAAAHRYGAAVPTTKACSQQEPVLQSSELPLGIKRIACD